MRRLQMGLRRILPIGLVLLAACGARHPEVVRAEPDLGQPQPTPAHAVELAVAGTQASPEVPRQAADAVPPTETRAETHTVPPGRPVLPPAQPGQMRWRSEGCLAQGEGNDADGKRFPAEVTRARQADVKVTTTGLGAIVTHALRHGCCLKGDVRTKVEGQDVEVREVLSGESCRCMCASTLRTAIGLKPGKYTLRVRVDQAGESEEVARKTIEIK